MFGKDQPDVITEEDVGNYVAELERQGTEELQVMLTGEDDGVEDTRREPSTRSED